MAKEYIQTELAIEVAKKALEDLCKEYGYTCETRIGGPDLYAVAKDELVSADDTFRWPEIITCNLTHREALKYVSMLYSEDKKHVHILKQFERIEDDSKE